MEKIKRKKLIITGAAGMLGTALTSLLQEKYELFCLDLAAPPVPRGVFFAADITSREDMARVFRQVRPWLVIHGAAYTDVDGSEMNPAKAESVNAGGTVITARLCAEYGAKMLYLSTDYVFDGAKKSPYTEEDVPAPLNAYGRSKLAGEAAVQEALKEFLIVRTSWLYGTGGKNFVDTILARARRKEPLKVVNDQRGSPTYTADLAEAVERLSEAVFGAAGFPARDCGIYHVSNGGDCTWHEFALRITALKKITAQITPVSTAETGRAAKRPAMSVLSTERYRRRTRHQLRPWPQALDAYLSQNV